MAANVLRNAFKTEKPHSSITDWIDILTADGIDDEAYDGIPEVVDAINLQSAGPTEASRAIRKKLKHGRPHQQYRALVILKALVENGGHKFKTTFADGQLTDALKNLASDMNTDKKVKKKALLVLASWQDQFKNDPSMSAVAGLYKQVRHDRHERANQMEMMGVPDVEAIERKKAKQEAKERQRLEEEARKLKEKQEKERKNRPKRAPFDFEKEKPKVLGSIVEASQASSNLVNAITLVNREKDSLATNERVQECLAIAKQVRKTVVRYIQLVEKEDLIGTLIEANERIINALDTYDKLSIAETEAATTDSVADGLAATHLNSSETELNKLQEKQRAAVLRAKQNSIRGRSGDSSLHPDLHDLNFGTLGSSSQNLPPPMRPTALSDDGEDANEAYARGSLSDFSDYDSSDEDNHNGAGPSRTTRDLVTVSDDETSPAPKNRGHVEDPFADPFAD
ncbi:VHS domain protein [Mycena indigotica]|uniref:VHS domain protein n=1 Tax=Mycena indigotica TaxID=2126181 RepID=A0A8H6SYI0_9AGAR|nr:VHS domain protein [Mycena indigotica]KAF7307117.1 VHS domain protein [Mycena indigotica]